MGEQTSDRERFDKVLRDIADLRAEMKVLTAHIWRVNDRLSEYMAARVDLARERAGLGGQEEENEP